MMLLLPAGIARLPMTVVAWLSVRAHPGGARVRGFPNAAAGCTDIPMIVVRRAHCNRRHASAHVASIPKSSYLTACFGCRAQAFPLRARNRSDGTACQRQTGRAKRLG